MLCSLFIHYCGAKSLQLICSCKYINSYHMISSFISLISMFSAEQILQLNNVICDLLVQLVLFQGVLDLELLDVPTHESV
jgi:hypothetical protein